jgi:hypothetical protein
MKSRKSVPKIDRSRPQGRTQTVTPMTGRWVSVSGALLGRIDSGSAR